MKIGTPLNRHEMYNPFFIVGSGRSGNTLLRRILNNHSELFIPPETYELGRSIDQFMKYPFLKWHDQVSLIYSNFQFNPEFETFELPILNEINKAVSSIPKEKQSLAYILNEFYMYYRRIHAIDANRWGDKTPLNTFSMEEIHSVFPNAKFIHIIRDPFDSIASYVKSGIYTDIKEAAKRYKRSLESAMEYGHRHPESYMEIFYANLVREPEKEIMKICFFLGITYESTMLEAKSNIDKLGDVVMRKHHANVMKPIDSSNIGKGKSSLTEQDIETIKDILRSSQNERVRKMINGVV